MPLVDSSISSDYIGEVLRRYPNIPRPDSRADQLWVAERLFEQVRDGKGALLLAGTGLGKTYILGFLLKACEEFIEGWADNPNKGFWLTPPAGITQTKRVLQSFKLKNPPFVTNYDQLRAELGKLWVEWRTVSIDGDNEIVPFWDEEYLPPYIFADEAQQVKNAHTLKTKVLREYAKHLNGLSIFSSATPACTPEEMKSICLGLRPVIKWGALETTSTLKESLWAPWISTICHHKNSSEISPANMARLKDAISDYIVQPRHVHFDHRSLNHTLLVEFSCESDRRYYCLAYEKYCEKLRNADKNTPEGRAAILVAIMKFREACEFVRAPYLIQEALKQIEKGRKVIVGFNFLTALERALSSLTEEQREKCSVIRGGQSRKERQRNVDAYQQGENDLCLLTIRSGGVALSLHHDRNPGKPRVTLLSPTWSAIELVQVLGRAHRINSLSTTRQYIIMFAGTEEEFRVKPKYEIKLRSLKELVGKREIWNDLYTPEDLTDKVMSVRDEQQKDTLLENDEGDTEEMDDSVIDSIADEGDKQLGED